MQKTCHYAIDLNMRLMWLKEKIQKKRTNLIEPVKKTKKWTKKSKEEKLKPPALPVKSLIVGELISLPKETTIIEKLNRPRKNQSISYQENNLQNILQKCSKFITNCWIKIYVKQVRSQWIIKNLLYNYFAYKCEL